jgi:hypothetical protein
MAQTRSTCKFCGGEGLSDEHIFAKWTGRLLTKDVPPGARYVFRHRSAHPEAGIAEHDKTASMPAYRTRSFCARCNNGWMSRLEERVRPILEPLILGEPRTLSSSDQETLAFCATKTLLGFQSIDHPTTQWARPEDYAALYAAQAPLPYSRVWLGATDDGGGGWQRAHEIRLRGNSSEHSDGFGATLSIGHAVFYLLIGYGGRVGTRLRYQAAFALKEIWPSAREELKWPPSITLPELPATGVTELVVRNSITVESRSALSRGSDRARP